METITPSPSVFFPNLWWRFWSVDTIIWTPVKSISCDANAITATMTAGRYWASRPRAHFVFTSDQEAGLRTHEPAQSYLLKGAPCVLVNRRKLSPRGPVGPAGPAPIGTSAVLGRCWPWREAWPLWTQSAGIDGKIPGELKKPCLLLESEATGLSGSHCPAEGGATSDWVDRETR